MADADQLETLANERMSWRIGRFASTHEIRGSVSGLVGGSLVLQNNGGDDLMITADGSFSFPTGVANNDNYLVTVLTQPRESSPPCTVINGSGTVAGEDVSNIEVICSMLHFRDRFESQ